MEELKNLLQQLIDLLEQSFEGFETLWEVRGEIKKLIYRAGMECVPILEDWNDYNTDCNRALSCFESEDCTPGEYLDALYELKNILIRYTDIYSYYAELNNGEMAWSIIHENNIMKDTTVRLSSDYEKFMQKIIEGKNFALIRCADGEYCFMNGITTHAAENWTAPSHLTELGKAIRKSIEYIDTEYYYGISCPCCDPKAYFWYLRNIGNVKNVTFSNIWVNCNYRKFTADFLNLNRDTILIANYRAKDRKIGNLNILRHYSISDDCVSFWEKEAGTMLEDIKRDYGDKDGLLYAVAAGPMSGPIIQALYENNPNNCYIDFGSSLDSWFHETKNRLYMIPGTAYAERDCFMPDPSKYGYPKITAVMSLYKRPEALVRQLEAVENQSIKPWEIILFQDAIEESGYRIILDESIKERFTNVKIAEKNQGVWERFRYTADVASGDYICVLDDDTIPGERWFENCYMHMIQKEGIYGTVGIGMIDFEGYPVNGEFEKFWRFGWPNPVPHCMEVDFAGHSWFFKRKHLENMLEDADDFSAKHKYAGEDAYISYANSKKKISTIIPTHYLFNKQFWGSISSDFGTEKTALSLNIDNLRNMGIAVRELVAKDWCIMQYRNPEYMNEYVDYGYGH